VRLIAREIFVTGVLLFECALSSRTSSLVHVRRFVRFFAVDARFVFLAIINPGVVIESESRLHHAGERRNTYLRLRYKGPARVLCKNDWC
jgi:hypothetical protein